MSDQRTRDRSSTLFFYGSVLLLAYLLYLLCAPFLRPLVWAAILAVYFYPLYRRLETRLGKNAAAGVSTAGVALIIVVPAVLIVIAFVQQGTQAARNIDLSPGSEGIMRLHRAWEWLQRQRFGNNLGSFEDMVAQAGAWLTNLVTHSAGGLLQDAASMIMDLIVILFSLFFFFRDGDSIRNWVWKASPFEASFSSLQITETGGVIRASISAGIIVASIQGLLGGLTFALLGLGAPIFWGVMMGFFALLPLGSGVVWVPAAAWLLLTGHIGYGIALIAVGAGVIGLVDNLLRPILLSGRTEMNGLLVFVSLLGGIAAFGLLGLVLGPVIMAISTNFMNAYIAETDQSHRRTIAP